MTNSLGTEILRRYGLLAVICAIAFAFVIWKLADEVAAPGGEVSVLWGFVQYTKKPDQASAFNSEPEAVNPEIKPSANPLTTSKIASPDQSSTSTPPAIDLFIRNNVTQANFDSTIRSIHSEKKLRELTVAESGRRVQEIPSGTYFYVFALSIDMELFSGKTLESLVAKKDVSRYRDDSRYVEVQYPRDKKMQLVIFTDDNSSQKIGKLSGTKKVDITAELTPWGNANTLVSIPINRIVHTRWREVQVKKNETREVLDMTLR